MSALQIGAADSDDISLSLSSPVIPVRKHRDLPRRRNPARRFPPDTPHLPARRKPARRCPPDTPQRHRSDRVPVSSASLTSNNDSYLTDDMGQIEEDAEDEDKSSETYEADQSVFEDHVSSSKRRRSSELQRPHQ